MIDYKHEEPTRGHPRAGSRESTEARLVEAALSVFAERGYEGATTKLIAQTAGVSEALIQRYFNGKEGLLNAVILHGQQGFGDSVFGGAPLFGSLEEEARWTMIRFAETMGRRSEFVRVVLGRVLLDPAFRESYGRILARKQVKDEAESRLARYAEAGLADPSVDVSTAAEMLVGMCFEVGFVHPQILRSEPQTVADLVEGLASLFGRALRTRSPSFPD